MKTDPMYPVNLAGIDLNLLVALEALLREQNVTRAAKAVGLSQPAMSNALSRLRKLFDDPLLIRTPEGMLPTPRAESLAGPLAAALRQIGEAVFQRRVFDPKSAVATFNVATQDYELLVLVPALTERLAREAPGVRLHFTTPRDRLPVEDLYLGRIDLMIGLQNESQSGQGGLFKARLIEESFACLLRNGHPELKGTRGGKAKPKLTLQRYAALDHMLISPYGGMSGSVDVALAKQGLARRVMLAVPHFALAPWILVKSDYVLTLPERAARQFAERLPVTLLKPPLELPSFTEYVYWHERTQSDPAHQWFRQVLREVAAGR